MSGHVEIDARDATGAARDAVADVAESLMAEYENRVPLTIVSSVVIDAHRELDHQIPGGAMPEMLHRLAGQRLSELAATA